MTTSTLAEVLAPRRPPDDVTDESLPADLTIQIGSAGAPVRRRPPPGPRTHRRDDDSPPPPSASGP
jgi:hypothetical protein